jgi:hypothetical protein
MVGQFEQIAPLIVVFLIMLGMGASLTPGTSCKLCAGLKE